MVAGAQMSSNAEKKKKRGLLQRHFFGLARTYINFRSSEIAVWMPYWSLRNFWKFLEIDIIFECTNQHEIRNKTYCETYRWFFGETVRGLMRGQVDATCSCWSHTAVEQPLALLHSSPQESGASVQYKKNHTQLQQQWQMLIQVTSLVTHSCGAAFTLSHSLNSLRAVDMKCRHREFQWGAWSTSVAVFFFLRGKENHDLSINPIRFFLFC